LGVPGLRISSAFVPHSRVMSRFFRVAAALGPALPPMGPFSPSALGVGRRSRASKSPVLVLKREQMLAGGGEAVAAGAIVEVEGEGC
jgi:hypothetical protein